MKKGLLLKLVFITLLFSGVIISCSNSDEADDLLADSHPTTLFAYLSGVRTPLERVDGKFYVVYCSKNKEQLKTELAKVGIELTAYAKSKWDDYSHFADMTGSGAEKFTHFEIELVNGNYKAATVALSHTLYWAPWYRMVDGTEIVPTELLLVKLKPHITLEQLEKLAQENNVEMIGWFTQSYLPDRYLLICTNLSKGNSLAMAALFYESGLFEDVVADTIGGGRVN